VIRKDFTVSEADVCDTRLMGADCVLLITAALGRDELVRYHRLAVEIGLDVLVEIHDERELDVALAAGATMVGVNQRDLVTFQVDHERAVRMAGVIPDDVVKVAESGVRGPADARSLRDAGYHAILVGESLVTAADPTVALAELCVR
jgi:indole-3-glycerol phosphate synthase